LAHATKTKHAQFCVHILAREPFRATPWLLMPFAEEAAYPIVDVIVDGLIRRGEGAIGEDADQPPKSRFNRVRTSGKAPLFPGVSTPLTFAVIRCTLFFDGLAPRYLRPLSG
jgi:hypothetical protein